MSEVLSETASGVSVEKNVLKNQNSEENMVVSGDNNQDDDGGNTFLAVQETEAPQSPEKNTNVEEDEVAAPVVMAKPKLMFTTEVRPRLRWTHELHNCFLQAVDKLGGPHKATPKSVQQLMDLDGLGLYQIKSHLQKYRLGKFSAKEYQDTAKNVTELVGGSWDTAPRRMNEFYHRRQRAKRFRKNNNETREQFKMRVETEKHVERLMEAQRMGLLNALNRENSRGIEVATNQNLRNEEMENEMRHRQQAWNNYLANYRTIPGAPNLGNMARGREPQFYPNQQNAIPRHNTLATQANTGIQGIPLGYQPQTTHYPAPRGLSILFGGYGSYPANLYQGTLTTPTFSGSETSSYQRSFPTSTRNQGTFPTPSGSGTSSYPRTFPTSTGDQGTFPTPSGSGSGTSSYQRTFPVAVGAPSSYQETFATPFGSGTSSYQGTFPTATEAPSSYQETSVTPIGSETSSYQGTFSTAIRTPSSYQETLTTPTGSGTSSYQGTFPTATGPPSSYQETFTTPIGSGTNSFQGTFLTPGGSGTSFYQETLARTIPTGPGSETGSYHGTIPTPTPTATATATGSERNSYQGTFPTSSGNGNGSGSGSDDKWLTEEDIDAFLNLDDNELNNLDFWT